MIRKLAAIFLALFLVSTAQAQSKLLYYVNPFSNSNAAPGDQVYAAIDPDTGTEFASGVFPSVAGRNVVGGIAITTHPVTGELWALLKLQGLTTSRELVKVDATTFAVTDIGSTGRNFSTLAFNADGSILYAVTGNGDANPEVLYTLDQTTGAATQVCALGNGADGEVIAWNSDDEKLYHWSGNGTVVYERIDDLTGPSCAVTNIGMTTNTMTTYNGEVFGAVYDTTQNLFYISNISSNLLTVNVDGTNATIIRRSTIAGSAEDVRGIALVLPVEIDVLGNENSIASGDVTPSVDDNTDFGDVSNAVASERSFSIENTGASDLILNGDPVIALTGDPEFSVVTFPDSPVSNGGETSFTIGFIPTELGTKTAVVSISSNDSNESPYTFTIQATALTDTDADGTPDATDTDDDNDGVSDEQEAIDGTDPLSADSYVESLGTTVCTEWNGYLDFLFQVLEQRNSSEDMIFLTTTLYNLSGVAQGSVNFSLEQGQQRDLIINDFPGFTPLTYGTICTTITSGAAGSLDGNYVYYLLGDQFTDSISFADPFFEYAFSEPLVAGKTGSQFLTYNTYGPSLSPADSGDLVASYIQVSNDEASTQTGQLIFYNAGGTVVRTVPISLAARRRVDIDAHSLGVRLTGLVEWLPSNTEASFRVRINRYYFDGDFATGSLKSATSIPAKRGSGQLLSAAFSTISRYAVLEISNTLANSVTAQVNTYQSDGEATFYIPGTINIPARGTRHIILDEFLDDALGNVTVDANTAFGVVVSLLEYGLASDNSLRFANSFSLRESAGLLLVGSYNNFLGTCTLRISNSSASADTIQYALLRYDLSLAFPLTSLEVPAYGSKSVDICSLDQPMSYGIVAIFSPTASVVADVVRKSNVGQVEFTIAVKPSNFIGDD